MPGRIEIPNLDDIIERYKFGIPLQRLSKETGYTRTVLGKRLIEAGVKIRSYSDGQRARWHDAGDRSTAAKKWLGKAWEACKGLTRTPAVLHCCSRSKYMSGKTGGRNIRSESAVADFLESNGFHVDRQFPVGPYNLDLTLHKLPIAIEITYASPSDFNSGNYCKRLKHLLDRGWFVIYIIAAQRKKAPVFGKDGKFLPNGGRTERTINLNAMGEDLITWLQHARRNKSLAGHYWVIWGQGDASSKLRRDFNQLPLVPCSLRPHKIS